MTAQMDEAARLQRLVEIVQAGVAAVVAQLPDRPAAVHLAAGEVRLEVQWPASAGGTAGVAAAQSTPPAAVPPPVEPDGPPPVRAPSVGTFYRAPEPDAAPFVAVGDKVVAGQQVGIVEAMKLMIPVTADRSGRVVEILVADGAPVEYDDPLVAVAPE